MEHESSTQGRETQGTGVPTSPVSPRDLPPNMGRERWQRNNRPHRVPLLGPVFMILIGSIFLLNNLGFLPWAMWGEVWRLWPFIPIAVGLDILLGRRSPVLSVLIVLGVLAAGVVILYSNGGFRGIANLTQAPLNVPLNGARSASVALDFGAGELTVGSLGRESGQLASGTPEYNDKGGQFASGMLEYYNNRGVPDVFMRREGDTLKVEIKQNSDNRGFWFGSGRKKPTWDLKLNPSVPIDLDVNAGASQSMLDLRALQVTKLSLDVGASDTTVLFPSQLLSNVSADINAGAAHVRLVVPDGVAARVDVSGSAVSSVKVDERFTKQGEAYETKDFANAEGKLNITLDAGAASIDVTK